MTEDQNDQSDIDDDTDDEIESDIDDIDYCIGSVHKVSGELFLYIGERKYRIDRDTATDLRDDLNFMLAKAQSE
jgi:histidinol phosphatase-like PHP family hydrolase